MNVFFDLLYLRAVVKGHPLANKRFSAVHYAGSQYDEVGNGANLLI